MFRICKLLIIALIVCICTNSAFARNGGDDVGNGGFAYKQSVKILKMASTALTEKIRTSTLKEIVDNPSRRLILQNTLGYESMDKFSKKNKSRGGRLLEMDYTVNPQVVIILKPYFVAFSGKTDTELEDASLEVQKRLLHEAAHIWGYNEDKAETFAIAFLKDSKDGGERPRNFTIKPDFCACRNGRSDIYSQPRCDSFCADQINTMNSILYAEVDFPNDHPLIHNLYDWCMIQLPSDVASPKCFLKDTDSENLIPINIARGSNTFSANINAFDFEQFKKLKLEEQTSEIYSKEFWIKRIREKDELRMLNTQPVNQYTCFNFGGNQLPNGDISKDSYARVYYYFNVNSTPAPIPASRGTQMVLCHDDQIHPGNDSALYPRLELVEKYFTGWDYNDFRFGRNSETDSKIKINSFIENRMLDEYNIKINLNLFFEIRFPDRPNVDSSSDNSVKILSIASVPFIDRTGKSFCPTKSNFEGQEPLFKILKDYIPETEGLYLAEKEVEVISANGAYKNIYATVFVTEGTLKNYGFYIENGVSIRATPEDLHERQIYFYGPVNSNQDPLLKAGRKLFTIKQPDDLNGQGPILGIKVHTSDKRIGCIPKGALK